MPISEDFLSEVTRMMEEELSAGQKPIFAGTQPAPIGPGRQQTPKGPELPEEADSFFNDVTADVMKDMPRQDLAPREYIPFAGDPFIWGPNLPPREDVSVAPGEPGYETLRKARITGEKFLNAAAFGVPELVMETLGIEGLYKPQTAGERIPAGIGELTGYIAGPLRVVGKMIAKTPMLRILDPQVTSVGIEGMAGRLVKAGQIGMKSALTLGIANALTSHEGLSEGEVRKNLARRWLGFKEGAGTGGVFAATSLVGIPNHPILGQIFRQGTGRFTMSLYQWYLTNRGLKAENFDPIDFETFISEQFTDEQLMETIVRWGIDAWFFRNHVNLKDVQSRDQFKVAIRRVEKSQDVLEALRELNERWAELTEGQRMDFPKTARGLIKWQKKWLEELDDPTTRMWDVLNSAAETSASPVLGELPTREVRRFAGHLGLETKGKAGVVQQRIFQKLKDMDALDMYSAVEGFLKSRGGVTTEALSTMFADPTMVAKLESMREMFDLLTEWTGEPVRADNVVLTKREDSVDLVGPIKTEPPRPPGKQNTRFAEAVGMQQTLGEAKPELHESGAMDRAFESKKWEYDRGAMPGEPYFTLNRGKGKPEAAITEIEVEDGKAYWALVFGEGPPVYKFSSLDAAIKAGERGPEGVYSYDQKTIDQVLERGLRNAAENNLPLTMMDVVVLDPEFMTATREQLETTFAKPLSEGRMTIVQNGQEGTEHLGRNHFTVFSHMDREMAKPILEEFQDAAHRADVPIVARLAGIPKERTSIVEIPDIKISQSDWYYRAMKSIPVGGTASEIQKEMVLHERHDRAIPLGSDSEFWADYKRVENDFGLKARIFLSDRLKPILQGERPPTLQEAKLIADRLIEAVGSQHAVVERLIGELEFARSETNTIAELWEHYKHEFPIIEKMGVKLEAMDYLPSHMYAFYRPSEKKIVLSRTVDTPRQAGVLRHELEHALDHLAGEYGVRTAHPQLEMWDRSRLEQRIREQPKNVLDMSLRETAMLLNRDHHQDYGSFGEYYLHEIGRRYLISVGEAASKQRTAGVRKATTVIGATEAPPTNRNGDVIERIFPRTKFEYNGHRLEVSDVTPEGRVMVSPVVAEGETPSLDATNAAFEAYMLLKRNNISAFGKFEAPTDVELREFATKYGLKDPRDVQFLDLSTSGKAIATRDRLVAQNLLTPQEGEEFLSLEQLNQAMMARDGERYGPVLDMMSDHNNYRSFRDGVRRMARGTGGLIHIKDKDLRALWKLIQTPEDMGRTWPKIGRIYKVTAADQAMKAELVARFHRLVEPFDRLPYNSIKKLNAIFFREDMRRKRTPAEQLRAPKSQGGYGLNEQEMTAYESVRGFTDISLDLLADQMLRHGIDPQKVDKWRVENEGYMPHVREGSHFLAVKDKETGEVVYHTLVSSLPGVLKGRSWQERFTLRSREDMIRKFLPGAKPKVNVIRDMLRNPNSPVYFPPEKYDIIWGRHKETSPMFYEDFNRRAINSVLDLLPSDQTKRELKGVLDELLAKRGFGVHLAKREDIPGYLADFRRPLAQYATKLAGYLSKLQHMPLYEGALRDINPRSERAQYEYAKNYMRYMLMPAPNSEVPWLRGMLFDWFIAGKFSTALVNSTAQPMFAAPALGMHLKGNPVSRITKARAEVLRAMSDIVAYSTLKSDKALKPDERVALSRGEQSAALSAQIMEDMAGMSKGTFFLPGSQMALRKFIRMPFAYVERYINREAAFLAFYRTFRDKGMTFDSAVDKAVEWTSNVHFRYGKENRPMWGRKLGAAPYTFRGFITQAIQLQKNMILGKYSDPLMGVTRLRQWQAVGETLATALILGGAAGSVPFWDNIKQVFLEHWGEDPEEMMRRRLQRWSEDELGSQVYGNIAGDILTHGLPAALPGEVAFDLSGSLALNIVPFDLDPSSPLGVDIRALDLLGAVGGVAERAALAHRALKTEAGAVTVPGINKPIPANIYLAMESIGPDFIRNVLRAHRLHEEGALTRGGKMVRDPETGMRFKYNDVQAIMKSFGFQPRELNAIYEHLRNREFLMQNATVLKAKWVSRVASAVAREDWDAVDRVMGEIRTWNDEHRGEPWMLLDITVDDIKRRILAGAKPSRKVAEYTLRQFDIKYGK